MNVHGQDLKGCVLYKYKYVVCWLLLRRCTNVTLLLLVLIVLYIYIHGLNSNGLHAERRGLGSMELSLLEHEWVVSEDTGVESWSVDGTQYRPDAKAFQELIGQVEVLTVTQKTVRYNTQTGGQHEVMESSRIIEILICSISRITAWPTLLREDVCHRRALRGKQKITTVNVPT